MMIGDEDEDEVHARWRGWSMRYMKKEGVALLLLVAGTVRYSSGGIRNDRIVNGLLSQEGKKSVTVFTLAHFLHWENGLVCTICSGPYVWVILHTMI